MGDCVSSDQVIMSGRVKSVGESGVLVCLEKWHSAVYLLQLFPSYIISVDKLCNPLPSPETPSWRSHVLAMHDLGTLRRHVGGKGDEIRAGWWCNVICLWWNIYTRGGLFS